jgi:HAMP domain-containing protein
MSSHWAFVLAAYAIAAVVLVGYWWRVERRLRALEAEAAPRGSS